MTAQLDHIVLGARDLESGVLWAEEMLGRPAQGGGAHPHMGTHNRIWSLGDAYLELIAIDSSAEAPPHPRWFGLDDPEVQARLQSGPRLLTWAARVDNLDRAVADSPVKLGTVQEMSRGDFRWKVALREDGALLHQGQVPICIEWLTRHPAATMPDSGLRLTRLIAGRSETTLIDRTLQALGAGELIELRGGEMEASLMAEVMTEDGAISFAS